MEKKKSGICIAPESLASDVSADSAAIGSDLHQKAWIWKDAVDSEIGISEM